jgi:UDP-N-acetylglucosamine diphosphorylase / glucose-1-phosphate thymidylyltransferase / UDP-N-acetylgalactosamine diphosphorylase / glucosamine-1-phosphate N-acetyltransferase / galactosamine-1-phosphate N-acetyltransferase
VRSLFVPEAGTLRPMLPVYLFDDEMVEVQPLTGLRASFEVRIGPFTVLERLLDPALRPEGVLLWGIFCSGGLAPLMRERTGLAINELRSGGGSDVPVLVLNGRCAVPDWPRLAGLRPGMAIVEPESDGLVAACVPEMHVTRVLAGERQGLRIEAPEKRALLTRPWHARRFRDVAIEEGLAAAIGTGKLKRLKEVRGATMVGEEGVWAAESARVMAGSILDTEGGPIVIADRAVVRPGAIVLGPAYIGPGSTVLERATVRANTVIGPSCKVNGEVIGCTFQGFSNKAHDGFLGDSWVGEWVNLGAGTTNSNLLNTYGEVIARGHPMGTMERTGEQFLGAVIGDHVKTAICTRIMTGAVIHTGAMLASTAAASGCVGPFAWVTDGGSRGYRLEKFVEVMRAAMLRRNATPSAAYLARVGELHGGR